MRQLLLFGFPPPGHPYWTRRPSKGCEYATRVSTRAHGVRRRQAASWMPGTRATALRWDRVPDELDRSLALRGWDGLVLLLPVGFVQRILDIPEVAAVHRVRAGLMEGPDQPQTCLLQHPPGGGVSRHRVRDDALYVRCDTC
jgi:hypothetical protein